MKHNFIFKGRYKLVCMYMTRDIRHRHKTYSLYYTLFFILQTFKNRDISLETYTLRHKFRDITFWGIDKC